MIAELFQSLARQLEGGPRPKGEVGEVPASHYLSAEHFERERAAIFARVPQIVATESELERPGARVAIEVAGSSVLVVRGEDDRVRGFKNACRHRSTRLVELGPARAGKAIICPYHGWSYDLSGCRIHAPHAESFRGEDACRMDLVPAFAAARDGLVWAGAEPFSLEPFLAPIAADLSGLELSKHRLFQRASHRVAANWKLIIDAFLEGYHIRHLHRDTVYRFFLDACFEAEQAGPHIRSIVARRAMIESKSGDPRVLATASWFVFPNAIFIQHPDYVSVMVAVPEAVDRARLEHTMLVPRSPSSDEEREHWEKSFDLIDGGVFAKEDLFVVEAMQRGLETGANTSQLFGDHEYPALWFHRKLADYVQPMCTPGAEMNST